MQDNSIERTHDLVGRKTGRVKVSSLICLILYKVMAYLYKDYKLKRSWRKENGACKIMATFIYQLKLTIYNAKNVDHALANLLKTTPLI